jgi:hypothetical protein
MLRLYSSESITKLLKAGIGVLVLVVGPTHHSPGGQETLPVCITICGRLSISMRSDSPLDKVLGHEVGFGKTIC